MKNVLIFLSVFLLNIGFAFAIDCGDIDCPQGWTPAETGWVVIQLNEDVSCIGKICYCYDLDTLQEKPQFWVKKIIWLDTICYPNHYSQIDNDIFKKSLMTEFIRIHMNELRFVECPNFYQITELILCHCYASYIFVDQITQNRYPLWVPCDGPGYCVQSYKYCWNTSQTPWVLTVTKFGPAVPYQIPECFIPNIMVNPNPNIEPIHGCIQHCY